MYRYKVIDIHPRDPRHPRSLSEDGVLYEDPIKVGQVLEAEKPAGLKPWPKENWIVYGYSYGHIGDRWFFAIKVEDITGKQEVEPDPWIPVSERLPEFDGDFLVWCGDCVDVVYFNVEDRAWDFFGKDYAVEPVITHWMPFPEPPKK